jgi:hypothetical protein
MKIGTSCGETFEVSVHDIDRPAASVLVGAERQPD